MRRLGAAVTAFFGWLVFSPFGGSPRRQATRRAGGTGAGEQGRRRPSRGSAGCRQIQIQNRVPSHTLGRDKRDDQHWRSAVVPAGPYLSTCTMRALHRSVYLSVSADEGGGTPAQEAGREPSVRRVRASAVSGRQGHTYIHPRRLPGSSPHVRIVRAMAIRCVCVCSTLHGPE